MAVHQELTKLGEDAVYCLETDILEMRGINKENWFIEQYLIKHYHLHPDTATMLVAGAESRKCSKMLQNQYNQEDEV